MYYCVREIMLLLATGYYVVTCTPCVAYSLPGPLCVDVQRCAIN